ncbi:hypothetical protein BOTBODRAFT_292985 [Botryobasidium botryosum FD-172 SS1]|uniref:Uncharacterized protein n=1 Tax=Botryobasidium botryosum (strain FD-172 SS1) TaxID=930990 RepID=A0A067MIW5_BOTB1|nr:hypothetical protein BOTBODRAFT_292985 [Botryobasidium botryosum FD-172 SS1]
MSTRRTLIKIFIGLERVRDAFISRTDDDISDGEDAPPTRGDRYDSDEIMSSDDEGGSTSRRPRHHNRRNHDTKKKRSFFSGTGALWNSGLGLTGTGMGMSMGADIVDRDWAGRRSTPSIMRAGVGMPNGGPRWGVGEPNGGADSPMSIA